MKIQLNENYYLRSDERNIILSEFKGLDKEEKEKWKSISYHSTIQGALKAWFEMRLRKSDADSFDELAKDIQRTYDLIEGLSCQLTKAGRPLDPLEELVGDFSGVFKVGE